MVMMVDQVMVVDVMVVVVMVVVLRAHAAAVNAQGHDLPVITTETVSGDFTSRLDPLALSRCCAIDFGVDEHHDDTRNIEGYQRRHDQVAAVLREQALMLGHILRVDVLPPGYSGE
jgi:hypothetical protein